MIFIDACLKKPTPYTPVWMMRQAGRYLPEYMRVRAQAGDFLSLCKDYKKASEVTIQPVEILGVDAAILFSDILVVPLEMGMDLRFEKGEGPVFDAPITTREDLDALDPQHAARNLSYVYDAISLTRERLALDKALIGFCGAPWTLATYMIEGRGSKTYAICKKMLYTQPQLLREILDKVTDALISYVKAQIRAGVNAVQIFDSWAGALEESAYLQFGWAYILRIPIIVFPKGVGASLDKISGNFDVLGVDWSTPISKARKILSPRYVLQGNMEPTRLYSKEAIDAGVDEILSAMNGAPHIFNLGHGILPDVPVENAKYFIKSVQEKSKIVKTEA